MKTGLVDALRHSARSRHRPDGEAYQGVSVAGVAAIAGQFGLPGWQVEVAALENGILPERYTRNMAALDAEEQVKLLRSHVAVVGLGGLGGTVAETLARIGVGTLTLIDGDAFDDGNLNRQLFAAENSLGLLKAEAAASRIAAVNSSTSVRRHVEKLTRQNAAGLIGRAQLAVDCLDSITSRFVLEAAARQLGIPMVSAAVGGYAGQLTTIFPEDRGLELVYGPADRLGAATGAEMRLGNLPFTVSTVASLESAEVVHVLLRQASNLRNHLLVIDLQDYSFERIRLM